MDSILELPSSHGIEIDDIIRFGEGAKVDSAVAANEPSYTESPGVLLVAKVCEALVKLGYDDTDISNVGRLVSENLMTSETSDLQRTGEGENDVTTSKTEVDTPATRVGKTLGNLLDKDVLRSRTVHINSNEPVVLINHAPRMSPDFLGQVTNETVTQLQNKWNIWPVRVYAGPFVMVSADGFSITLLNVVNTNLGGPNMVELLDMPCDAVEWSRWRRKDLWRDRQFLYSETQDGPPLPPEFRDDGSEQSITSDGDSEESLSWDSSVVHSPQQTPLPQGEEATGRGEQDAILALPPRPRLEDMQEDVATVQLAEGLMPEDNDLLEAPEPHIEHPTWSRQDDSISLLDLIRSQAATLSPFGKDTQGPGSLEDGGDVGGDHPAVDKSSSDGSDDFVVV
ncbi:hypothetical protein PV08_08343 [Exophiala spinifera]|uniref:DhaK domain-containing protein n=1 Tax=Exophiala spinifera TaxID=91928 RepID=A0A0D1YDP7_9EURO|nr:uncharacterized protein PV08_08343 [Exophiala spinifera]KIW13156.1 hypothetical protein PV08_08343 [Exophiala spinifera]